MTAIILAGGKSSRTTKYKAFMRVGREKLIDRVILNLKEIFDEVIIVADEKSKYQEYGLKIFIDKVPNKGPLMGLYTGLLSSSSDYNFAVGCDQPFLNTDLIKYMINKELDVDIVIPRIRGQIQPLHALYRKSCLPFIEKNMKENRYSLYSLCKSAKVGYIEEDEINSKYDIEKAFFNVNTDLDLLKAEELI
ncbi:MAG: molybdenum cofactor guanylyltransferase [bacterium]|nr:molybdenum cofactor guanylyltransferase [bacterium]